VHLGRARGWHHQPERHRQRAEPACRALAAAWSLDGAIQRVIGAGGDAETDRRQALERGVFAQLGVDPAAFNDAAG
jgi:hypothetical protein